jgi:hypothetical protein
MSYKYLLNYLGKMFMIYIKKKHIYIQEEEQITLLLEFNAL